MSLKTSKFLICILTTLFVTNSCKKSDKLNPGSVDLTGVYGISNTINVLPLNMYSMNGEITDQTVIKDYIRRSHDSSYFILDKATISYDFGKSEIDFSTAGSVTWTGALPPPLLNPTLSRYTISQKSSDGFVLEAVDSTLVPKADYGNDRAWMLFDNSNTIKMVGNCGPFYCTSRTAFPFIIKGGQLYLQLYACSIKSSSGSSASSFSESQMVGSFDMALIKQLMPGDTVLVQNKTVQFNKK